MTHCQTPLQDPALAARWLLAEYEATDVDDDIRLLAHVTVQPIFTLKSVYDPGEPMRITSSDYQDHGRWWL